MPIWGAHIAGEGKMGINAHTWGTTENVGAYEERVRERESDEIVF